MTNKDQRGVVTIEMNGQTFRAEVQLGSSWFGDDDPRIFTFGFIADSPEALKALADYCNEHIKAREAAELLEEKGKSVYARCCASDCQNKAEWTCGTWQFCDECASQHVEITGEGEGFSRWGTSRRIGQAVILAHNVRFDLKHLLIEIPEQNG